LPWLQMFILKGGNKLCKNPSSNYAKQWRAQLEEFPTCPIN